MAAPPPPPDSPLVRPFALAGAALGVLAAVVLAAGPADLGAVGALAAAMLLGAALLLRRSRRRGEPAEHRRVVAAARLGGAEQVLVVGDPRLAAAAGERLTGGRVEHSGFDPTDLPFPAASFDAVLSALALHALPDRDARDRACAEVARVLRPGGRAVLLEFFRVAHELELGLEDAGLTAVRRSGLRPAVFPPARRIEARRAP